MTTKITEDLFFSLMYEAVNTVSQSLKGNLEVDDLQWDLDTFRFAFGIYRWNPKTHESTLTRKFYFHYDPYQEEEDGLDFEDQLTKKLNSFIK